MTTKNLPVVLFDLNSVSQNTGQCDCADCDCACALPATRFTSLQSIPHNALLMQNSLLKRMQLDDGYAIFHGLQQRPVVLNRSAENALLWFTDGRTTQEAVTVFEESNVIQQLLDANLLVTEESGSLREISSTILAAWLHITDRCNLRCAYCYLPHKKEDMSLETCKAAIDAMFHAARVNHYQSVKFKYAGGEALLRFPFVVELHQYAQELAGKYNLGLDGVILSNGTLLVDEMIEIMQSLGLRLMISLDGMGDWHDVQRPYAGGRGTFHDVANSVDLALSYGLIPDILITISGRNAAGLPEIVAWVSERDLPFSLNFYRQNDLSVSHEDLKLEEEKIIDGMLAAFAVIEKNLPSRSLLASLIDRANLAAPHLKTCSVGDSYLVFNQHGQVAKCQMKMSSPIADVKTENLLQVVRDDKSGIQNISVEEKEGCRDCEWMYWCTGGCPLETYRATGRYDVKSPNCSIYKTIFPEVLRLEGLRLLKEAGELYEV